MACFNAPGKLRRHQKRHDKGKGICKGCCNQNAEMQNFVILRFFFYYYLSLKVGIIILKLCKIQVLKLSQAGVLWVENSLLPLDQH